MDMEDKIFDAIERMMAPPKITVKPEPVKLPKLVCGICGQDRKLLKPEVVERLYKIVPKLRQCVEKDYNVICKTCLKDLLRIHVHVRGWHRIIKFDLDVFRRLIELQKQKPVLKIKVTVDYQRYREIVKRKWYRKFLELAQWDYANRIRDLHERQAQLRRRKKKPKDLIKIEDVIDIIEGRAVPRPPISCEDCTRAVCPVDCPNYQKVMLVNRVFAKRRIDIDEWQLSDYEDFP